jgi:hypothetical protein
MRMSVALPNMEPADVARYVAVQEGKAARRFPAAHRSSVRCGASLGVQGSKPDVAIESVS